LPNARPWRREAGFADIGVQAEIVRGRLRRYRRWSASSLSVRNQPSAQVG